MTERLEAEFDQAMVNIYHTAASLGYRPTYFLRMVSEHGGVIAAKRLLRAAEHQSGLTRLYELDRLDISAEALVLQERWKTLFTDEERQTARGAIAGLQVRSVQNERRLTNYDEVQATGPGTLPKTVKADLTARAPA